MEILPAIERERCWTGAGQTSRSSKRIKTIADLENEADDGLCKQCGSSDSRSEETMEISPPVSSIPRL